MDDNKKTGSSVWGAGYHAGYEARKKEEDTDMRQEKIDRIAKQLTAVSRKVYEVVPITEAWSLSQIINELRRNSHTFSGDIVPGCLDSLRKMKLIKEPNKGYFIRVTGTVRQAMPEPIYEKPVPNNTLSLNKTTKSEPVMCDPVAIIENLTTKMDELKAEFEQAAIEISDYVEQSKKDVEKMRQLQALLKSIND